MINNTHRLDTEEYFRTDPTYQPELSAYLTQLLADRERLAGALPQLADWARRDAVPSDEEIDAVRRLLRANDEALAALDDDDRAAVEVAISTMRKERAMLGATFPVELHGITAQPVPGLFPPSKPPAGRPRLMADPAGRLAERRRLDSQNKAARVIAALDAMVASGTALSIAALARNAGVSRRFIYDHPELRAEAERRTAQIIERHTGAMAATARVTAASLRADLANATAANHRLSTELAALRRRLGQLLGQEALNESGGETADLAAAAAPRLQQLEATLFATQEELARRTEELEAARQINRELISRVNHHGR